MIPLFDISSSHRIAWTLLHFLWQGTLLGLMAWATSLLLRRKRPQIRYLVLCAFMLACLIVPLATFFRIPASFPQVAWVPPSVDLPALALLPPTETVATPSPIDRLSAWGFRLQPLLPWALSLWIFGLVVLSIRTVGGWFWLRKLKTDGLLIPEELWTGRLKRVVQNSGVHRLVHFLESDRISGPMSTGVLRPIILVPLGFFANLDPIAVEALLAHELAHIRRHDVLVNGLQCALETLLFFHPAVWWISHRIRTEREHCCDDAAIQVCGDPVLFAEILNQLDTLRTSAPRLATAASGGNILERMRRLLSPEPMPLRISPPGFSFLLPFFLGSLALMSQQVKLKQVMMELPKRLAVAGERLLFQTSTGEIIPSPPPSESFHPIPATIPLSRSAKAPPHVSTPGGEVPAIPLIESEETQSAQNFVVLEEAGGLAPEKVHERSAPAPRLKTSSRFLEFWPSSLTRIEAATLPFRYSPYSQASNDVDASRMFRLEIQPGERLLFQLEGEDSKITLEARIPSSVPDLGWRMALMNANFPPRQARNRKLEIRNPTRTPQVLDLIVYGLHGYSYRIDLMRTTSMSANS